MPFDWGDTETSIGLSNVNRIDKRRCGGVALGESELELRPRELRKQWRYTTPSDLSSSASIPGLPKLMININNRESVFIPIWCFTCDFLSNGRLNRRKVTQKLRLTSAYPAASFFGLSSLFASPESLFAMNTLVKSILFRFINKFTCTRRKVDLIKYESNMICR